MKRFVPLLLIAFFLPLNAHAVQPANYENFLFESDILGEIREVVIRYPDDYQVGDNTPVVYLTDAEGNFRLVESYLDFSHGTWPRLPEMVVVGLINTDRNRDFVPRADPNFPNSGGGDQFVQFFKTELIPFIQARTSQNAPRILFGHSFGGVNALNILFTEPDLFNAYIAVGTSTWVSNDVLFERAIESFQDGKSLNRWLYMSVAEADGGATVPKGKEFAKLLEDFAPSELNWTFEIIPKTDHFSAVPPSLTQAFDLLFPAWQQGESLRTALEKEDMTVEDWFANEEERLDWRFYPQAWDLMITAFSYGVSDDYETALKILDELIIYHPQLPELYVTYGDILTRWDKVEEARTAYNQAHEIALSLSVKPPRLLPIERRLSISQKD